MIYKVLFIFSLVLFTYYVNMNITLNDNKIMKCVYDSCPINTTCYQLYNSFRKKFIKCCNDTVIGIFIEPNRTLTCVY